MTFRRQCHWIKTTLYAPPPLPRVSVFAAELHCYTIILTRNQLSKTRSVSTASHGTYETHDWRVKPSQKLCTSKRTRNKCHRLYLPHSQENRSQSFLRNQYGAERFCCGRARLLRSPIEQDLPFREQAHESVIFQPLLSQLVPFVWGMVAIPVKLLLPV